MTPLLVLMWPNLSVERIERTLSKRKRDIDMNTATTVFKSRWGFHPCDYKLFLQLKRLHKWYWQAVYDFHHWHRWWRKEEQNRIGPQPTYCPAFVENKIWYKSIRIHGEDGFKLYPKTVIDHGVVELYQFARMPQTESVTPFDAETKEGIESLYEKVRTQLTE